MTHPKRFTDAVTKLYNAFHDGTLEYGDCQKCAVGNIVGHGEWYFNCPSDLFKGKEIKEDQFEISLNESGYSVKELATVEKKFIMAFSENNDSENRLTQFNGLCAVVEYLCELDNIPNIMDYTSLFETENDKPKVQLETVFS